MINLLRVAFGKKKHRMLCAFSLIFMCLLTVASQVEIVTIGFIARKGPSFFELFSSQEKGSLDTVSKEEVLKNWTLIDKDGKGVITKESANEFLASKKNKDFLEKIFFELEKKFDLGNNLIFLAVLIALSAIFKALMIFAHRYTTKLIAISISQDLRKSYFDHIQVMPMSFYQKYNLGSLSNRVVSDSYIISEAINACLMNYFQTPFTILTTLILCFLTSWKLSLFIFLGLPLIVFPIYFLAKKVKKISKQILKEQELFASTLIDFISGIQTIKSFTMEDFSKAKYAAQNNELARLERKSAKYDLLSRPVVHTIGMLFLSSTIIMGLYVYQMNVSEILIYCGFLYLFYEPVKKFAEENNHIQRGIAASERLQEVLTLAPEEEEKEETHEFKEFKETLSFENVWFRFNEEWVLKGLNFSVKKGEMVAIVGPTGCGKSTALGLLSRLYDPEKGDIRIDGVSIKGYSRKSIRENVAVVPQKPFIFVDTVAKNIAFGRSFSESAIKFAAKEAEAHEFIESLPKGYATELLEAGKNLSGGQQQRLTIARALIKPAPFLVLDEATSSLDALSEHKIKKALSTLKGKVTQIIVAHRLSTIQDADKIIYMEKGVKVAEGTKDELLVSCQNFRLMWNMLHQKEVGEAL